ncbi:hypothetical protein D3C78_1955010 [compost metagenome]
MCPVTAISPREIIPKSCGHAGRPVQNSGNSRVRQRKPTSPVIRLVVAALSRLPMRRVSSWKIA